MRDWETRRKAKQERMRSVASLLEGKLVPTEKATSLLQTLLRPGDRIALKGDNQKQADFLARTLTQVDAARVHDLHLVISCITLPQHLDVFEKGICRRLDLSYAGEQSVRMAQLISDGTAEVGAIHTYIELYARMFVDLIPDVAEAAAFHDGVVVVLEPLFTRDPRLIGEVEILQAMMAIRGVYERHEVIQLNHGIGFDTAAIESGWVESIHSFGSESGMEDYTAARPDVFFTGRDGSLRSNRVLCQLAGQYAIDLFIGSSLQIDRDANSSTVTEGRLSGFGGAPNMGHDPHGRRHATPAWLGDAHGQGASRPARGRRFPCHDADRPYRFAGGTKPGRHGDGGGAGRAAPRHGRARRHLRALPRRRRGT